MLKNQMFAAVGQNWYLLAQGAGDVGEIADRAARRLASEGVGKMFCVTGVGGRVSGIMKNTKSASKILSQMKTLRQSWKEELPC